MQIVSTVGQLMVRSSGPKVNRTSLAQWERVTTIRFSWSSTHAKCN